MALTDSPGEDCLAGGGEMGARMRTHDWAATPVGPVETWPQSLKTAVSICLGSRYPIVLWWGKQALTQFYNDAYISFLGPTKHPGALGQSARECWSEIWHIIDPMLAGVFATGEATWSEDFLYVIARNLPREEGYFTFSYSAIRDDAGEVGGIFCACYETTSQVIGRRRLRTLGDLGRSAAEGKRVEAACEAGVQTLAANRADIPFALIYLLESDGEHARLSAATGLAAGSAAAPVRIDVAGSREQAVWPLSRVMVTGTAELVPDILTRFGPLPGGPWPESPETGYVVPFACPGQTHPIGFLVTGFSPRRVPDADYRTFFELVAGHLATAVTNARAHEEERRRAEALAELDRAKTAFFSNVSHEFRTPLTLMLGPVEDALADGVEPLPAGQRERLQTVHRSSMRLLKLVNTLLDFSRIEAGRVRAVYEPTDLAGLTAELASSFRSACEKAGVRLVVDCPPLPEPVYVDRDMWEKIVLNLVSNAFKFTLEGQIDVRLRAAGKAAELAVQDTGTGISAKELPRIFERFYRPEGARGRTHEGTGIGLALVQELAKLHGGFVRAASALGTGSTFTVSIPLGMAHLPADRVSTSLRLTSAATGADPYVEEALRWLPDEEMSPSFPASIGNAPEAFQLEVRAGRQPLTGEPGGVVARRPRILWADDNSDMRDYVRRLLNKHYDVEAVPDGEAALAAAQRRPPDLVLTDVMMPRLDGFGLLRALRAEPRTRTTPVILLSARAGEESRVEGLEAGADDYLVKPFSARELLARVGAHVQLKRLREEAAHREQALLAETQAAGQRLEAVLQSISDGFIALDQDWRYTALNNQACESMGMRREEILGRRIWDLFPDTIGTPFEAKLLHAATEQTTTVFDFFYTPRNRWFENRVYPAADGLSIFFADVTARKQAEERLRQSEALLAEAQRLAHVGSWSWDLRTDLITWSDEHYRIMGLPPQTGPVQAGRAIEFIHPDDREPALASLKRTAADHEPYELSLRIVRADGTVRHVLSRGRAEYDDQGQPVRMFGTMQDITDRVRVEEAMRESEARFRGTFDNAAVGIAHMDSTCHYIRVNQRFCEILGYSLEDLREATCLQITHPDDTALGVGEFDALMRGKLQSFSLEKRYIRKDGKPVWVNMSASLQRDAAGRPAYAIEVIQDISDRKRAEEAVRESEARFRALAENVPSHVWTCTLDKQCDYVNPQFTRYTGQSEAQLLGDRRVYNIHPDDHATTLAAWEHSVTTGEPAEFEARVRRHDGAWRWFQIRAAPIRDARGEYLKWFGINTDIDDLKRAQAAMREAKESAEKANQVKDEFLATVSHELRTPLAAILLWSQLLESGTIALEDQGTAARAIRESARAQQRLIEDLLDVSRILAGELRIDATRIGLAPVVHAAVQIMRPAAEAKHIVIEQIIDRHAGRVRADAGRIQQVILNLINNAIKFTPAGGRVSVQLARAGGAVEIRVSDTGQGIEPEFLPHVFERFRQADGSLTRRHGGLGLGLAITRELVELHGGTVHGESPGAGQGATFTVQLPVAPGAGGGQAGARSRSAANAMWRHFNASSILSGIRALVVEDDRSSREVIQYLLERCEAKITAVEDAAEALAEFREGLRTRRFNVLLSDIGLPEMSGYELMQQIRAMERQAGVAPPTPAVALTAYARDQDRAQALAAGFSRWLIKPIVAFDLVKTIAECAGRSMGAAE